MMRYSYLLTVCACLVWNVSTAQRTTPSTATELNKSRTNATATTEKPAVSASGRSGGVTTPQSNSAKAKPKSSLTATNTGTATKKATIPATTSRAGYQNNVKPVKPLVATPAAVA